MFTFDASLRDASTPAKQLVSQNKPDDPLTAIPVGYSIPALEATYGWYRLIEPVTGLPGLNTASIKFAGNGTPNEFFNRTGNLAPSP